jgi:hypothetical protein
VRRRLSDFRLAAMLGASVAFMTAPAAGQSASDLGGLRSSIPGQRAGSSAATAADAAGGQTAFEVPTYGNPSGFGAGTTGFDSTGVARRKKQPKPKPGQLQPGPPPTGSQQPGNGSAIPAVVPIVPRGAAGLRQSRQAVRHGVPSVEPPPSLAPLPLIVAPPRLAVIDPTPFEPLGLREGVFVIKPAVELTAGYDSNPEHISPAKGSSELIAAPELIVRSDWERHALNADIHGNYLWYGETFPESPTSLDRPTLDSRVSGRIDVSSVDRVNLESRLLVSTDNPGSPNIQAGLTKLPIVTTVGGTFGYEHDFNRFEILSKTTVDRSVWQSSSLTDGTTSPNDDRNFNQYAEFLRGSYELLPGVKPFVEASIDTRIHDIPIDRTGADRDSVGRTLRAGSTFQLSGKLTGEVSLGQTQREYTDPSLPHVSGFVYDASLLYAATPLTTVKLTAVSNTGELIVPGASGVLRRDFGIEVDHDFRRWLTGAVKFGYGADSYFGLDRFDDRYVAGATLTYKLTREIWIRGEYRHEWLRSTVEGVNYDANIALLTVRLQR